MDSNLDPTIVNLAQAIRHVESNGDYDAKGASGEYGAYQFEPSTWNALAPHLGVNVPLNQATPEEQNEVAYKQLALWKQTNPSWNVGNFASAWNAGIGNPNAYQNGNVGVNSQGVSYNTPAYAAKIANTYQEIKSGTFNPFSESPTGDPITQSQPQTTAVSTPAISRDTSPGMPSWQKWLLGGLGVAAGIGVTALTGGADLLGLGAAGAVEGAADVAGAGAVAGEAAEGGGLISSALNAVKPYAEGAATGAAALGTAEKFINPQQTPQVSLRETPAQQQIVQESQIPHPPQPVQSPIATPFEQSSQATQSLYNAQLQSLQQNPSGRVLAQTPEIQNGMQGNAIYGLAPEVENGNYNSTDAIEKSHSMVGELSDNVAKSLDAEGTKVNLNEAVSLAKENMRKYTPSFEWDDADKHIDKLAASYKKNFADKEGNISLGNLERLKKEQYRASKFDLATTTSQRSASKSLSFASRDTIKKHTKSKDLYELAMKEEQRLIQGQKVLKRLDGKKAFKVKSLKGDILHHLSDAASTAIGARIGGPLGAILGGIVGHHLTRAVDKKYGRALMESPAIQKALSTLGNKKPEVAKMLREEIAKYGKLAKDVKEGKPLPKNPSSSSEAKKQSPATQHTKPKKQAKVSKETSQGRG